MTRIQSKKIDTLSQIDRISGTSHRTRDHEGSKEYADHRIDFTIKDIVFAVERILYTNGKTSNRPIIEYGIHINGSRALEDRISALVEARVQEIVIAATQGKSVRFEAEGRQFETHEMGQYNTNYHLV